MQVYIKFPGVTSGTVIYVDKVNFYAKGKDSLNNPQSTVSTTHLPFTHVQPSDILYFCIDSYLIFHMFLPHLSI